MSASWITKWKPFRQKAWNSFVGDKIVIGTKPSARQTMENPRCFSLCGHRLGTDKRLPTMHWYAVVKQPSLLTNSVPKLLMARTWPKTTVHRFGVTQYHLKSKLEWSKKAVKLAAAWSRLLSTGYQQFSKTPSLLLTCAAGFTTFRTFLRLFCRDAKNPKEPLNCQFHAWASIRLGSEPNRSALFVTV